MNKQIAKQIIQKTKNDYNRIAPQFDSTRKYNWKEIAKAIDGLDIKKGAKVLDLGCGGGRLYDLLEKYRVDYTGIDISKRLIDLAKKKYPGAKFKVSDVASINLDEKYDYVFSIAVLHHIPSKILRDKTVENIKNALKPGGTAAVSVWYFWNQPKYIQEIVKQFLGISSLKFLISNQFSNSKLKNSNLNQNSRLASKRAKFNLPAGKAGIQNSNLPWGDFLVPWKNQNGEVLAQRYHHAWTVREFKKYGFKIVSKDRNLIGIYKKTD